MVILRIIFFIFWGCVWGKLTQMVIENKNYSTDWFWWGFFFGIIALIIACLRPAQEKQYVTSSPLTEEEKMAREREFLQNGGWKCKRCGALNASYTGTCSCGMTKLEN